MTVRRTAFFASVLLGASLNGGSAAVTSVSRIPEERMVSFGFEDVVTASDHLAETASKLDSANVNSVSLSAGRLDWTAFPWDEHPESASAPVRETGRDYVAEAMRILDGGPVASRRVTITVDALVPRWIEQDPSLAGVGPTGIVSPDYASVSALDGGAVGERLIGYVREIAQRYRPDAIELTELMFDDATFGTPDLASYRSFTSRTDWPRTEQGTIDTKDASLSAWRSSAVARLVQRATAASHAEGVALHIDVRAPWHDPRGDRAESGHDYARLARVADRLVVWDYFALEERPPAYTRELARALVQRRIPFTMSVGMWAETGRIPADDLGAALLAASEGGATAVAVTPASLLGPDAWRALQQAWRP